jgi:hypothetical protein
LTLPGKMGYISVMFTDILLFVFRLLLTIAICGFVWSLVKPATQSMRVLRAALLVLCLLAALYVLRGVGVN